MALIECPNCGKKISDSTDTCVHCKFDLKKARAEAKAKKAFGNIPKQLQKQYVNEFCCSNKTYKKIYQFKLSYILSAIATSIGGFCSVAMVVCKQILKITGHTFDIEYIWTIVLIASTALLSLTEIFSLIIVLLLERKIRKGNVIFYTEFSKWLSQNKQLELNYIFDEKEKKLYKILYPEGEK